MFTLSMNIQSVQRGEGGSKSPAKYPNIQAPPSPPAPPPASLSSSLWRFWKWIPPTGARPPAACATDNYGQLMAHFKEHLAASQSCLYAINELRLFATLEVPEILDYVSEDGVGLLQDEAGRGGRGSSASSSSLASAYSSASSSSGNCGGTSAATAASSSSSSVRGYYIFKEGIWPLWEDEYNAAGGCWTFRHTVARNSAQSGGGGGGGGQPREMWKLLILTLSDPRMAPFLEAGEICGAGLTVRQTAHRWIYKFSIWNSNADNTIAKLMIGSTLKSLVSLPNGGGSGGNGTRLFYYSHRTNMLKQQQQLHFQHPLMGGFKLQRKMAPRNSLNYLSGAAASRKKSVTFLEQY